MKILRFSQNDKGNYVYGFIQENDGEDLYAAVQKAVDDARAEGADYVFLLGHLGNEAELSPYTYADVLGHTSGIDVMLDGHSHDMEKVVMKNRDGKEIIRQASGTRLEGVGWMRLSAADGSIETGVYTWSNSTPAPKVLGIENEMSEVVDGATDALGEWLNTKVGVSAVDLLDEDPEVIDDFGQPLFIIRISETNLGDLVTDAFRVQAGADVAIACGGTIRAKIMKGDIAMKDLISVYPFGNRVYMRELTGQQLLDALEWGAKSVPRLSPAFLQVSGVTFEIHTYIESSCQVNEKNGFGGVAGEYRVKNVRVGGEPLELDRKYKVVGGDYLMMNGGNGFNMFDGAKVLWQSDDLDYVLVAAYIHDNLKGVIGEEYESLYGQGRIVAVEK